MKAGCEWSKAGKIWATMGHLRNALNNEKNKKKKVPPNWELIILNEIASLNADFIINGKFQTKDIVKLLDVQNEETTKILKT